MAEYIRILLVTLILLLGWNARTSYANGCSPCQCHGGKLTSCPEGQYSVLNLERKGIRTMNAHSFYAVRSITDLSLAHNLILAVPYQLFNAMPILRHLNMATNGISSLPAGLFIKAFRLESIQLQINPIKTLPVSLFNNNKYLQVVNLASCRISSLPDGVFRHNPALTNLDLSVNPMVALPVGIFSTNTGLQNLNLSGNPMVALPVGIFSTNTALKTLDISRNRLTSLPSGIFDKNVKLVTLKLNHNQIRFIQTGWLARSTKVFALDLTGNPALATPNMACGLTSHYALNDPSGRIKQYQTLIASRCASTGLAPTCLPGSFRCDCPSGNYFNGSTCVATSNCRTKVAPSNAYDLLPKCTVDSSIPSTYGTTKECLCPANTFVAPHPCPSYQQASLLQLAHTSRGPSDVICACRNDSTKQYCNGITCAVPSPPVASVLQGVTGPTFSYPQQLKISCRPGFNQFGTKVISCPALGQVSNYSDAKCVDINECVTGAHKCHKDGYCINNIGSYTCRCKPGFGGFGLSCYDLQECAQGIDDCHSDATCVNTHGSYRCDCPPGKNCTDVASGTTGPLATSRRPVHSTPYLTTRSTTVTPTFLTQHGTNPGGNGKTNRAGSNDTEDGDSDGNATDIATQPIPVSGTITSALVQTTSGDAFKPALQTTAATIGIAVGAVVLAALVVAVVVMYRRRRIEFHKHIMTAKHNVSWSGNPYKNTEMAEENSAPVTKCDRSESVVSSVQLIGLADAVAKDPLGLRRSLRSGGEATDQMTGDSQTSSASASHWNRQQSQMRMSRYQQSHPQESQQPEEQGDPTPSAHEQGQEDQGLEEQNKPEQAPQNEHSQYLHSAPLKSKQKPQPVPKPKPKQSQHPNKPSPELPVQPAIPHPSRPPPQAPIQSPAKPKVELPAEQLMYSNTHQ